MSQNAGEQLTAIHGDVATKHKKYERINDNRGEAREKELNVPSDRAVDTVQSDLQE